MSRIEPRFAALKKTGRKALVPYITAGDPEPGVTVPLMHAMVSAGADMIELGVPFSDPMADGPVIQAACERALKHRVNLPQVVGLVRTFREQDKITPVVLMGYLNPVEIMGYREFARAAAAAGVDGVLTVDMPPEESSELTQELVSAKLDSIYLLAPTTTRERMAAICEASSGFVYYVSLKGVTGAANLDIDEVSGKLAEIREFTDLPIGVGFGVRDAESASRLASVADAVVVGTALIRELANNMPDPAAIQSGVGGLLKSMRGAMDARAAGNL